MNISLKIKYNIFSHHKNSLHYQNQFFQILSVRVEIKRDAKIKFLNVIEIRFRGGFELHALPS